MARALPSDPQADPPPEVPADVEFQRECVAFFSDLVDVLGVPRSVGQIYGLLFASPVPLRFTDIAERLAISRGSASQGLHALRLLGAVRTTSQDNGSGHRELFEPELGLRKLFGGVLREKVNPIVAQGGGKVTRLRDTASRTTDPKLRKFQKARVDQLDTWRRQVRLILPLLTTILEPGRRLSR